MKIADRRIGAGEAPFIIAEMSGNHNQSLERALSIVNAAAEAGAHALKLQTYTADTMTLDLETGEFFIDDPKSLWKGQSAHTLYQKAYTPWEWHEAIFNHAKQLGMIAFSSPFDESAVDFLEELGVPCYKIASYENTDLPLIRKAAATGKPLIISTGMASVAELGEAVQTAREAGCEDLVLLKCTSTYPATPENTNILTIPHMRDLFGCEVGLSDHTMGIGVSVAAVALGATVIEKHFTLARADGGVDSAFSLEPAELAARGPCGGFVEDQLCVGAEGQAERIPRVRHLENEVVTKRCRQVAADVAVGRAAVDLVVDVRIGDAREAGGPVVVGTDLETFGVEIGDEAR